MRAVEIFTLEAFRTALAQLDHPLDAEIQATLNQISETLAENATDAVEQLLKVAQTYPPLQDHYQDAYDQLQNNYEAKERHKLLLCLDDTPTHSNGQLPLDNLAHVQLLISQQILSSPESVSSAQRRKRLEKASEHALSIFNNPQAVHNWLHRPNGGLGGVIPVDLMDTDVDAHKVHTILGRIEHGVFS